MWDLPRPGLEPVSPALAGRFSTAAPPGKPQMALFLRTCFYFVSRLFTIPKYIEFGDFIYLFVCLFIYLFYLELPDSLGCSFFNKSFAHAARHVGS